MAIKYYDKYPQRWESPSQDYPQGAFKNLSALGEQDGSYLEKDWLNDQAGFFGALLRNAEMTPNGLVDTAQKSQFYDALLVCARKAVDLSGYYTKAQVDTAIQDNKTEVVNEWGDRVDATLSQDFLTLNSLEKTSIISMMALGATPDNDCYDAYEQAINMLGYQGGTILFGAGKWWSRNGFTLHPNVSLIGVGRGVTILTQPRGQNKDILKSKDFDMLTGVGPIKNAPRNIQVLNLTVDGNYLEDYKGASIHIPTSYNNTKGFGVKMFATKYNVNIELVNCAEVGWYSEAFDYTGYEDEHSSHLVLDGRVFGKEALVYRGVPDCNLAHIILGCAGWKATKAERQAECQMSELFEGQPVHVFVSDEADGYTGHHEFGFMHLYGNYNGYGYYCNNTGRLKGNHLVVENCRGGFKSSARTWGGVTLFEAHNNGRLWNGTTAPNEAEQYYDIHNVSNAGFFINGVIRQFSTEQKIKKALLDEGGGSSYNLSHFTIGEWTTANNTVCELKGTGADLRINSVNAKGIICLHNGTSNKVNVTAKSAITFVMEYASNGSLGNSTAINSDNCRYIINNPFNANPSNYVKVTGNITYNGVILTGNHNTVIECNVFKGGNSSQGINAKNLLSNFKVATAGQGDIILTNSYYKELTANDLSITTIPTSNITGVEITLDTIIVKTDSSTKRVIVSV